jgi:hypothetical protein
MSSIEKINQIEFEINTLRLDLIRIMSEINFIIGSDRRNIVSLHYKKLKEDYHHKRDRISILRSVKDSLQRPYAA